MHNCTICKRETINLYECYSADKISESSYMIKQGVSYDTYQTQVSYKNINHHEEYICTKCILYSNLQNHIKNIIIFTLLFIGSLLLALRFLFFVNNEIGFMFSFGFSGLFFVFNIYTIIQKIKSNKMVKTDQRIDFSLNPKLITVSTKDGTTRLIELLKGQNINKSYLTPYQYENLKLQ